MKKRLMIDLETMSVTKSAAIIQIGAVVFRPTTPEFTGNLSEFIVNRFCANIILNTCRSAGLATDESTIEWWNKPENKEAYETTQEHAMGLGDALRQFRRWALDDTDPEDIEPWANGASFDLAILETAYRALRIPHPWKHYNERCYRTMKSLYRDVPKPEFVGTKHNAADDAHNQAVHLLAIMQHIDRNEQFVRHMTEGRDSKVLHVDAVLGEEEFNRVKAAVESGQPSYGALQAGYKPEPPKGAVLTEGGTTLDQPDPAADKSAR